MLTGEDLVLQFALEASECHGPTFSVFAHPPFVDQPDRNRVEKVQLLAPSPSGHHQPGILQQSQVLHDAEAGHRNPFLKSAQRLTILFEEGIEKISTRRVR